MGTIQPYTSPFHAVRAFQDRTNAVLFRGDCLDLIKKLPDDSIDLTITSPPYCIGKEYEESQTLEDFVANHKVVLPEIVRITKKGGSICWQTGYRVKNSQVFPLDYVVFGILSGIKGIVLRNRIIWTYGHGVHSRHNFSGRHEIALWFTKGDDYAFDLDAVREPQKYPGKRNHRGPNKGKLSGNPNGKNPSDVWSIPNVKANHIEKSDHPCQFPVGLADRLVRALCPADGIVFDPYMGSGSTGVAALINKRVFLGAEIKGYYMDIALERLSTAQSGTLKYRPAERPIFVPHDGMAVAKRPPHFREE